MASRPRLLALLAALSLVLVAAAPGAALTSADTSPRDDADWTEHYFPMGDEPPHSLAMLHADVLRPKGLADDVETPVILTVSPYTNHSGATTGYGATASGPSDRFFDFLEQSDALNEGYTYVMVDLPGTGGSGGCNDWGGEREQQAVKAAVEWAASESWSNGRVGLIGKSYDAWTGLMGVAQQPEGLAAVVAHAPVYSGYRYYYNNGVRFLNSVATPALFQAIDAKPGPVTHDPYYNLNGAPQAWCYGLNIGLAQNDDPDDPVYWVPRDLLRTTDGRETPVFLLQGFLETNTKPDGAFGYWNGLAGTDNKAWFGQFSHDRGWDRCSQETWCTGRDDSIEQTMAFFDTHLKGLPADESGLADIPTVTVQDNLGRYRAEDAWPPADALTHTTDLRTGTYTDDGNNRGSGSSSGQGIWTVSETLDHDVWLTGEPVLDVEVTTTAPRANLAANVYDLAPSGQATLVSRGTWLLRDLGTQTVELPLYGQDWLFREGHRVGVLVSGANAEWWVHVPTRADVTVDAATVDLPFLTYDRTEFDEDQGSPTLTSPRLNNWLDNRTTTVSEATIDETERPFTLPGPLEPRP